jgi:hypothetical protein
MVDRVEIVGEALKLLQSMEKSLRGGSATIAGGGTPRTTTTTTGGNRDQEKAAVKVAKSLGNASDEAQGASGRIKNLGKSALESAKSGNYFSKRIASAAAAGYGFEIAMDGFKTVLMQGIEVTKDYFRLQSRGISGTSNLADFYVAAAKAGMSLQEYTQLVEENSVVVARSGSFKDFNNRLEASTDQLAGLGIFGKTARDLSATMMTSATKLGVPQKELGSVVQSQIKTFQNLRDMTGMTADGFKQLVAEFSNMSEVQDQLLGMAPEQRAAAQADLLNSFTLGQQMGLTAQQSKALGSALLAQRKLTAVDRFKAAGTIRQAGAIAGMSSADTEELARLSQKKNKTAEETARFAELGGNLQKRLEQMQNSGNISAENIADQLQAQFPGLTADALKQSGIAQLTKESGQAQKNFTATTGDIGQMLGKLATAIDGFTKSPLYEALKGVGEVFIGFMAYKKGSALVDAITGAGKIAPGASGAAAKAAGASGAAAKAASASGAAAKAAGASGAAAKAASASGAAAKAASATIVAPKAASSLYGAGYDNLLRNNMLSAGGGNAAGGSKVLSAAASAESAIVQGGSTFGKTLMTVGGKLGSFLRGSAFLGIIIGGIEEAFTGQMASALGLGDGLFGRLTGIVIAGLNSFVTGITRLLDDGINWLMEGLGLSFKSNLTGLFDGATSLLVVGFKGLLLGGMVAIRKTLAFIFGDNIPFVKSLDAGIESLNGSIAEQLENTKKMNETEGGTLRKEGEQVQKRQELAKKSETANQAVTGAMGGVVNGLDGLVSSAQSTVKSAQANMAKTSSAQVATPGPTPVQNVNQPDVNTNKTQDETTDKKTSSGIAGKDLTIADMIAILQQQLDVAKQTLVAISAPKELDNVYSRNDMPNTSSLTNALYSGFSKSA